jgi:hypothetical protein
MSVVAVFVQAEGLREVQSLEIESNAKFRDIKAALATQYGFGEEVLLFVENGEEPVDELIEISLHVVQGAVKVHAHRCRRIEISVRFNNETVEHSFSPAATVARVKHWAAVKKFGMTEEEAGEHALQIAGTHDRPHPGTHLGSLAECPQCRVAFDLVPDERINGASKDGLH